ncbi:MAG: hypothetical protein EPO07_18790 [Verrucomicrobia bacterium]|nr:MAG: hypothetical protein EPO07_18790 [Verrucomicrobiota bacterium]
MTSDNRVTEQPQSQRSEWLWIVGLLLAGVGARLWLIDAFSTPLPFWDSWEDTRTVFSPYFEGKLTWSAMFSPHNEHRIFFTRIYDLALLLLDGQWNNQVQAVLNAFIYSGGLTAFGCLLARLLGRQFWPLISLLVVSLLVLPFAWENTVAGFHSQAYFLFLAGLLTIWLLGFQRCGSWPWWCGLIVGVCGLFTMGAGPLATAAVCGLVGLRLLKKPSAWKQQWPTLVVGLVITGFGLSIGVKVSYHEALKAHSAGQFLSSLGQYLAWPWIVVRPYALFNLFPICLLAWVYLRNRAAEMKAEELALTIGGWAGLLAAGSAYTRGGSGDPFPPWRHMDATSFSMMANALSLILLVSRHAEKVPMRRYFRVAVGLWLAGCASGLLLLSWRALSVDLPVRKLNFHVQMIKARAYLATGEKRFLESNTKEHHARFAGGNEPQDHPQAFINMVNAPHIRSLLPSCVRDPLVVTPKAAEGFTTNGSAEIHPKIPGEVVWYSSVSASSQEKSSFESLPIGKTKFPFLEFRVVAGDLGQPGESLSVVDVSSGKETTVRPHRPSGEQWQIVRVKSPAGDFKIVAKHASGSGWFAFQAPREAGWLTAISDRLASLGIIFFAAGLATLIFKFVVVGDGRKPKLEVENSPARL